jgi:hypothetical protein
MADSDEQNLTDEVVVTDIVGETISVGNVIAYSRSGQGSKSLMIQLVSNITVGKKADGRYHGRISFFGTESIGKYVDKVNHSCHLCAGVYINRYYTPLTCPYRQEYKETGKKCIIKNGYTQITEDQIQDHIVVIKDPCYSINNPSIASLLNIVDLAKDDGYLSKEYNLGDSIKSINKIKQKKKK